MKSGSSNKQLSLAKIMFKFVEYDRVKYDLVKYNSDLAIEILEIYNLFFFLNDKKDLANMSFTASILLSKCLK